MPVELHWSAKLPNLVAASANVAETPSRVFLVARAAQNGGWNWASWSRYGRHSSLHGHAATREAAVQKAELAARAIHRTLLTEAA